MVMAVPILTNISRKTTMIAAVAMTMVPKSIIIMSMKNMMTMNAAVGTSIITSMRILSIMCPVILMTTNASFAIPMKNIATFAAKA